MGEPPGPPRRYGFSLIELLVVLGIIALLAGLLLPVLNLSRRAAMRVRCLNQTRQLAMAVQLYADDADGTLPGILPGRRQATAPWLRMDHLPASSLQELLTRQGIPATSEHFCCPSGQPPPSPDPQQAIWGPSSYQWFLGPGHGWIRSSSVPDASIWPVVMDPEPGLHSPLTRAAAFLDIHAELVPEPELERAQLHLIRIPSLQIDPQTGCRYFPEDCED